MRRHRPRAADQPTKVAQIFFVLDVDTHQPICLTTGTSARTVAKATPALLELMSRSLSGVLRRRRLGVAALVR
jgi:hypothetical protein